MLETHEPADFNALSDAANQDAIDAFCTRCMTDFKYFSHACLKIKTKTDGIQPFIFNRAQNYLNSLADQMIERYGKVRIVICKARQQGLSTWVEGRGYWKTIHTPGTNAFILTHEGEATKNLFNMAKRFHSHCPAELKPITKKSNSTELLFNELDSSYGVGTAKTGDTGRGQTIQFCHGSETAYWRAAKEISDGLLEGVPDEPGTEVYLESTAAGFGGYFHSMWQNACDIDEEPHSNWNGYVKCFIPWFWDPKYSEISAKGFILTEDEQKIVKAHDLSNDQMAWRRKKIAQKEGNVPQFMREYPATPEDAFNSSVNNVLINAELVVAARNKFKLDYYMPSGPIVMGVDVAREGDDSTAFVIRQGRCMLWHKRFNNLSAMEVCSRVIHAMRQWHIDFVGIDSTGGYGAGVYDRLVELGFGQKVTAVNFASRAINDDRYKNKRAEIWHSLKCWLEDGAQIPDSNSLQQDFCSVTYKFDSTGERLQLESKADMKKRGIKSPDCFVAGTKVLTPKGNVSIEALEVGDEITTPVGIRKIIATHSKTTVDLTKTVFSNGSVLIGRGSHKVFTWDKGWVRLDTLQITNIAESAAYHRRLLWNIYRMLCIKKRNSSFRHQVNIISQGEKLYRRDFFTDVFGLKLMVKYLKGMLYIIKTMIGQIMNFQTWNVSHAGIIKENTSWREWKTLNTANNSWNGLNKVIKKQLNGTGPKRVYVGIPKMVRKHGKIVLSILRYAQYVVLAIKLIALNIVDFAVLHVGGKKLMRGIRQFTKTVACAVKNLFTVNIVTKNVVQNNVAVECELPDVRVYNITLDRDNIYYANNILVANCGDAAALCFFRPYISVGKGGGDSFEPDIDYTY